MSKNFTAKSFLFSTLLAIAGFVLNIGNFQKANAQCVPNAKFDKIVSGYHVTIALRQDDSFSVWGQASDNTGAGNLLAPITMNVANYPALTGLPLKATIGGSGGGGNDQLILLTSTGLFAWGSEGFVLDNTLTTSAVFQKINGALITGANATTALPSGLTPDSIAMMHATYKTLTLVTTSGAAWVLTTMSANLQGDNSALSATTWHRVKINATTFLTGVTQMRGEVSSATSNSLMAVTSTGQVYVWGSNVYLGGGAAIVANEPFATPMTLPAEFSSSNVPSMIGVTGGSTANNTYYVLSASSKILWCLGDNSKRQCGDFTTTNHTNWVAAHFTSTAADTFKNIVYISPQEQNGSSANPGMAIVTSAGDIYCWGNNANSMLGHPTAGLDIDPRVPDGFTPGTDQAVFLETGGHTLVYVKVGSAKFCYVGHKVSGSMGDGTSASVNLSTFDCTNTPTIAICGGVPVVASAATSTISASPTSILASGVSTSTITVQLKTAGGTNLTTTGGTVAISTTAGAISGLVDNNDGTYTATLTSSTTVTTATISFTLNGTAATNTATVNFTPIAPITGPGTVNVGSNITLADVTPGGTWSSSNTAVGTIGSTGIVTGISSGTTTITYTVGLGFVVYPVTVNSLAPITGPTSVLVGGTIPLADVTPGGTWSSSNTAVGTIGSTGIVTGLSVGTTTITYTVGSNFVTYPVTVNPIQPITGPTNVLVGGSIALADATPGGTWSSSNTAVGTIGSTGIVSGLSVGTTTITYTVGGSFVTYSVTVDPIQPITGPTHVLVGSNITLADVTPGGTWSSSNTAVGTISSAGVVSGLSVGSTTITYTVGGSFVTYSVTVDPIQPITGPTHVLVGSNITLADATPGGTWSSSNTAVGTIGSTGIVSGLTVGSTTITYTVGSQFVTYSVTVDPIQPITGPPSVIVGNSITLADATPGGTWSSSNTAVGTINSSTGVMDGLTVGTTTITYTVGSAFVIYPLTVNPIQPITGPTHVLVGSNITLADATPGGTWSSSNTAVGTIGSTGIVSGLTVGSTTITYTVGSQFVTYSVTVDPIQPITGPTSVIAGANITLADATPGGTWSSSNTAVGTINSSTGVLSGLTVGTTTITYTVGSAFVIYSVTVNPLLPITGIGSVCIGNTVTLSDATPGGVWTSANTATATVGSLTGIVTGVASGTVDISYTVTGVSVVMNVTVNALPGTSFTVSSNPGCLGVAQTFASSAPPCSGADLIFNGTTSAASKASPVSTSTTNVTMEGWVKWNGAGAGPQMIISNGSSGLPGSGQGYALYHQAGVVKIVLSNVTVLTSTYTLTPNAWTHLAVVVNGSNQWTLYANGAATSIAAASATSNVPSGPFAIGSDVTNPGEVFNGEIDEVKFWNSSRTLPQVSADMVACYTAPQSGLVGNWTFSEGSGTTTADASGAGNTLTLTSTTWSTSTNPLSTYAWSFGDASTSTVNNATHTYAAAASYTSTLTVTSSAGCTASATKAVTVNTSPTASFTSSAGANTCSSTNVTYTTQSGQSSYVWTLAGAAGTDYTVIAGSTSSTSNTVTIQWLTAGSKTVTVNYTDANGCTSLSPASNTTNVTIRPTASFTSSAGANTCSSTNVTYTTQSGQSSYVWTLTGAAGTDYTVIAGSTSSTSNTVTVQWLTAGSKTVTVNYTDANGCTSLSPASNTTNVTIRPTPTFTSSPAGNVCTGTSVTYTTQPGQTGYTWSISGTAGTDYTVIAGSTSSTSNSVGILWLTAGARVVSINYTDANGCNALIPTTVTTNVFAYPAVAATSSSPLCVGGLLNLSASATFVGTGGTLATYSWTGPAGFTSSISNPGISGIAIVSAGTYTVSITTFPGCTTIATTTVTIDPAPTVTASNSGPVCLGGNVTFSVVATAVRPITYAWVGPLGFSSTATNPSITGVIYGNTGPYTITASTTGSGCVKTDVTNLVINPAPSAAPSTGGPICVGGTGLLLANPATTITGYFWTGPGGFTSTSANPSVTPTVTTTYTLTVSGSGTSGCSVSYTTTQIVNTPPTAITGTLNFCQGTTSALSSTPTGGSWSSSAPSIANIAGTSGVVTGVSGGTSIITYSLFTSCFTTTTVTVNPAPGPISGPVAFCVGTTGTLNNTVGGGTWTSSNTAVATIGSASGSLTAGSSVGSAVITYTLPGGCFATYSVSVTALPAAITGVNSMCTGGSTILSSTSVGGTWTSSNPSVATIVGTTTSGVILSGLSAGTSAITYSLSPGCSVSTAVTVNSLPSTITGTTTICTGQTTTLNATPAGGTWSSASPSVATIGSATGVVTSGVSGSALVTYSLSTGCTASVAIIVNPTPSLITGTTVYCAGTTGSLASTPSGGSWSSSNSTMASIVSSTGLVTALAAGNPVMTYLMPTGCSAATTITVNPLPAAIAGSLSLCAGSVTTLTNTSTGGVWTSGVPSVASVGSLTGIVNASVSGTTTITYTLPTGCNISAVLTVNALPPAITGIANVCVGSVTTLSNASPGGTWTSGNVSMATVGATTGVVSGVASGTVNITYTSATGCVTFTTVTVNPLPSAISGPGQLCAGATILLTNTGGGTWSSSNPGVATIGSSTGIVVAGSSAGSTTITYTLPTGCSITTNITVNPLPAAITGVTNVCVGSTTNLSDASAGGNWSSSNTGLAVIGSASGVVSGGAAGTLTITYTLPTGCLITTPLTVNPLPSGISGVLNVCVSSTTTLSSSGGGVWSSSNSGVASIGSVTGIVTGNSAGTAVISYVLPTGCLTSAVVTVNPLPGAITGTTSVCPGSSTILTSSTPGGSWTSSNPAIATAWPTGMIVGNTAGTVTITYTLPTGCFVTAGYTVNPVPAVITGSGVVCVGSTSGLTSASFGGTWSSSNITVASVGTSGVITGNAAGNAIITYTLPTGCYTTTVVTVNPLPVSITGPAAVCVGGTVTLSSGTPGGVWSSSNSNAAVNSTSGNVTGSAAGTSTISYTLPTGCMVTTGISINTTPSAITGTLNVCVGLTTTLSSATSGGTWTSGNTTIAIVGSGSGTVTGVAAGSAVITYSLPSGCFTTASVVVNSVPAAITGSAVVCTGASVALFDGTPGGTWSSSNTNANVNSTTGAVTGISAGTATITYTLSTGCFTTLVVTVNQTPTAITGTLSVCSGLTTSLNATPAGGNWTSSNTSVATIGSLSGVATGVSAGSAIITYTMPTGCFNTASITVNALPSSVSGVLNVCTGSAVTLAATPSGGTWSASNANATVNSTTGVVTGSASGTTTITYTLPTGCISTAVVTVNTTPAAITGTLTVCAGLTTTVSTTPAGGVWSSSNPSIAGIGSASGIITGNSAGSANITYTMPTGCSVSASATVNPLPSSISGTLTVCTGLNTSLSATPSGGTWSSSNANASVNSTSGVVTGIAAGNTTITYTLPTGCISTAVVTINQTPSAISGSLNVCVGAATTLSSSPTGGTWASTNPSVAAIGSASGIMSGSTSGTSVIIYTLPTGCSNSAGVTVNPIPSAISGVAAVCVGNTTTLSATPAGGTWSSSNISLATIGSATGIVTGASAGNPIVTYTIATGCFNTVAVTVNPNPSAISGIASVCVGSTTTLSSSPLGGVWSSSNPALASVTLGIGVVSGIAAGTPVITYAIPTGCQATAIVTVNPLPALISGLLSVCPGGTTTLSNTSVGGTWSSSNSAVASVGSGTGVVSGVTSGNATITYTLPTGCLITAVVTVNASPAAITGIASVCIGSSTLLSSASTGGTWTSSNPAQASVSPSVGNVSGLAVGNPVITYTLPGGCFTTSTVTVNPLPTAITGTTSICMGASTTLIGAPSGGSWSAGSSFVSVVSTTGLISGFVAGTLTITYTLPTGCAITTPFTVNVTPAPIAGTPIACVGSSTTLTETTTGGLWSSNNLALATIGSLSGVVNGVSAGNPVISYTMPTGCFASIIFTVNALPLPISGPATVCVGSTIALSTSSTGGTWSSSNSTVASVSGSGAVTGNAAGSANIIYTLPTGCQTAFSVTVNPLPPAIFGVNNVCVGSAVTLVNFATGGTWTNSNNTLASIGSASGVVNGLANGILTITYTLPTGCFVTMPFTVNPLPSPVGGPSAVCSGSSITLTSTGGGNWSSSNTTVASIGGTTGILNGLAPGVTTVTYTLPTGCSVSAVITVNPLPSPITGLAIICSGATSGLADVSAGGIWTSSNTAIAAVGSVTGIVTGGTPGLATITYTLPTGCATTITVTINPLPGSITGPTSVCAGLSVTLTSPSSGGTWISSNPAVASIGLLTGIVNGLSAGTTTITYTIPTGCITTYTITVNASPSAITGTASSICANSTAVLSTSTTGGTWSSGNTSLATIGSTGIVSGVAAGNVTMTYSLSAGCISTFPMTVNVTPTTITGTTNTCVGSSVTLASTPSLGTWSSSNISLASISTTIGIVNGLSAGTLTITYTIISTGCFVTTPFTVNPLPSVISGPSNVCAGASATYSSVTGGGTWSSSSTAVGTINSSGIFTGLLPGTTILTYALPSGCQISTVVTVNALPAPITGPANVCVGSTTTLSTSTTGGAWVSSNSAIATVGSSTGVVTGIVAGSVSISYVSAAGCVSSYGVTVNPLPSPISGSTSVCVNGTMTLLNTGGGTWTSSSPSLASIGFSTGIVTGVASGNPVITYTLPTGCINTLLITVNPLPSAITGPGSVCVGSLVTLSSSSVGGSWSSMFPLIASVLPTVGSVTGLLAGADTIVYTLPTGCSTRYAITVNPLPLPITGTATVCVGQTTALSTSSVGGTWSSSNSSLATVNSSGIVTGVANGTAVISYTLPTGCFVTTVVTVNALPAPISGSSNICVGSATTLVDPTGSSVWSSSNTAVATIGSTTGVVSGIASGTATISFTLGTGCFVTKAITINPLPATYTVSGGGSYCTGGAGLDVNLAGSQSGVTYQLYIGTVPVGSSVAGTGTGISFGPQTITGTYSVVATNTVTGCTSAMSGSTTVSLVPLPVVFAVTGGGSYCSGGAGVAVGLSGSQFGINYQLYNGAVAIGSPVAGTGASIGFGLLPAGTYSVTATSPTSGCTAAMSGSVVVSAIGLPSAYSVTGGGAYCSGGVGVHVGLSSSATGVNYLLKLGGVPTGASISGTGAALDFGLITTAGIYTISAISTVTSCTANMTGSATVTVNAVPAAYALTGGGTYCAGGAGLSIGLTGSQSGVNYQLFNGTTAFGSPVAGTGSSITFGVISTTGTYTAVATNATTGCQTNMTGSSSIAVNSLPAAYTVTGGGTYCSGGTGVAIGLANSQSGVTYQLFNGTVAVSLGIAGTTGSPLSFGLHTSAGTYSVVATNTATGCTNNMTGTAVVSVGVTPAIVAVTGGGAYCAGGTGVHVGLAGSAVGVDYQLYKGGVIYGTPVSGIGGALDFGLLTVAGTYTVKATNVASGCIATMSGSAIVAINALPLAAVVGGGGSYCSGGTGRNVTLNTSVTGVSYQLYIGGTTPVGLPVAGTGSAINFGLQTTAGTYTVIATNTVTGCQNNMTGSATIVVNPTPSAYTVTGGGGYCTGGTGVHVGLSGSAIGVNYQLRRGTTSVGTAVAGTGALIDFGLMTTAGTYTVIASAPGTSCTTTMTGSAVVTVNPLPVAYSVTGGGSYCVGGSGVVIGLSNSAVGITYQLYLGTSAVGSPVSGTGSSISFGPQGITGSYTVVATNSVTGCTKNMSGSATVSTNALPTVYTVTGGGSYCTGTGFHIGISGSNTGITYQLIRGTISVGSPVSGTGAAIDFGVFTTLGVYTVIARNTTTSCTANMSGSATISAGALPTAYNVSGGGSYCSGGTGIAVTLSSSNVGVNYQLYRGTTLVGSPLAGTGAALNFGLQTVAGGYTVTANASGGCIRSMTGSATVIVNTTPTVTGTIYTVAPASTITLTGTPSGGSWTSSSTWFATVGSGSGVVTGVALGTSNISYTLSTGCYAVKAVSVTPTGHRFAPAGSTASVAENGLNSIIAAPNPSKGFFTVSGSLGEGSDIEVTFEVTNLSGQIVHSVRTIAVKGIVNEEFRLNNLPNGMYLLNVKTEQENKVFHLVLEK